MSDGPEEISCPLCGTITTTDSIEDAVETAKNHDEMQHDGERTATVNGIIPPSGEVAETAKETLEIIQSAGPDSRLSEQVSDQSMNDDDSIRHDQRLKKLEEEHRWVTGEAYRILLWADRPLTTMEVSARIARVSTSAGARSALNRLAELDYISPDEDGDTWYISNNKQFNQGGSV